MGCTMPLPFDILYIIYDIQHIKGWFGLECYEFRGVEDECEVKIHNHLGVMARDQALMTFWLLSEVLVFEA